MPKLHNETDLEYKRRIIDTKSASFCGAKWYNATIWLGSGMTTSCHHPLPHKVSVEEVQKNPKALHNTPEKKAQRRLMQAGERPQGCEYCWKIEDMGTDKISDRVDKTRIYSDADLQTAFETPSEQDIDLQTLEISFDRTCQFACSYCNPAFSTTWVKDIKKHGTYTKLESDGRNHFTHPHDSSQLYNINQENPYVEAFFKWWESDLHKTLKELRITGGEPMMSGYTWRILEWFTRNPQRSQTALAINSNLGYGRDKLDRLIEASGDVKLDLYTSCEAIGPRAEYIRDGLDYEQWKGNVEYLLQSGRFNGIHVMCTINALCLLDLHLLLSQIMIWRLQHGREAIAFTLNILRFPSFQSPLVLDMAHKQQAIEGLDLFMQAHGDALHEHERNHIARLQEYLLSVSRPHSDTFDMPRLHNDFKQFYAQYDQRRNKDFAQAFPEYKEWYEGL